MADRFVNVSAFQGLAGGTPQTSPATSLTAGNMGVVAVRWNGSMTITGITDTAGNTWTRAGGAVGTDRLDVWYIGNALGHASNVLSIVFSSAPSFATMRVAQYSGFTSTPFIAVATGTSGADYMVEAAAATTTAVDQMAFVALNVADTNHDWKFYDSTGFVDCHQPTERADNIIAIGEAYLNLSGVSHVYRGISKEALKEREIVVVLFQATATDQPIRVSQVTVEVLHDGVVGAVGGGSFAFIGEQAGGAFVG